MDFIRLAGEEWWGVLMRPDDPLAVKETVSAGDLEDPPLVARTMVSYGMSLGFPTQKHLHFLLQYL